MIFDLDFNIPKDQQCENIIGDQTKAFKIVIEKLAYIQKNMRKLSQNILNINEELDALKNSDNTISKGIDALILLTRRAKSDLKVPSIELTEYIMKNNHNVQDYINEKIYQWIQQKLKEEMLLNDYEPVLEENFQFYFSHLSQTVHYRTLLSCILISDRKNIINQKIHDIQKFSTETTRMFANFLTKLHSIFAFEISLLENLFPKANIPNIILEIFGKIQLHPILNGDLSFTSIFEMNIMMLWYESKFYKILGITKGLNFFIRYFVSISIFFLPISIA